MNKKIAIIVGALLGTIFTLIGCAIFLFFMLGGFSMFRAGDVITEDREVNDFNQIEFSSIGLLEIEQGTNNSLSISADEHLLPKIKTYVSDDTLYIKEQFFFFTDFNFGIANNREIKYKLTVDDLNKINFDGLGDIILADLEGDELDVSINGAGSIETEKLSFNDVSISLDGLGSITIAELQTDTFNLDLDGAGSCKIDNGKTTSQKIDISGLGNYTAQDFESKEAEAYVDGSGSIVLNVDDSLIAKVDGLGSIDYYGNPLKVEKELNGAGSIINKED